jgi:WhiB family redox-sensing transcriptional regulator
VAGICAFPAWQEQGACRGSSAQEFFPPAANERRDEKRRRELRAKSICARCAVRDECLDYALQLRDVHGIWGGTSAIERRRMIGLSA